MVIQQAGCRIKDLTLSEGNGDGISIQDELGGFSILLEDRHEGIARIHLPFDWAHQIMLFMANRMAVEKGWEDRQDNRRLTTYPHKDDELVLTREGVERRDK